MKKNNKKIFIYTGLFLIISLFALPKISIAADVAASASRTSGVAPLSVHFNADLTASSPTERSFHDLEYSWNFGDTNAGIWGTDNKPKNENKGPVAAHVYETPGTFTATLNIRNATGIIDTKTFEITVTDPDVVFAGTKTTCVSTDADFINCPAGANRITTSDLSGLAQYADAGERVLLKRGSSWAINTNPVFNNNAGPVHIGAFGSCSTPNSYGVCSNAPEITGGGQFVEFSNKQNWTIADLEFTAEKGADGPFGGGLGLVTNILVSKVKITGFTTPYGWTHWRNYASDVIRDMTLYSSELSDSENMVVYAGAERLVLIGNRLQNSDLTHVCRVWQAYQGVVSHNIISGSSLTTTSGRHALKLHGPLDGSLYGVDPEPLNVGQPYVGTVAETGGAGLSYPSKFAVVTDNIFGASGPWPVSIGPQDGLKMENLSDIIFEKNKILAQYGAQSATPVQISLMFEGRYITVRNNILDGTGGSNGYTGISVERRGVEWTPLGNRIYNNTIYKSDASGNGIYGIHVNPEASDTEIRNNYISFPGETAETLIDDDSAAAVTSNNILTDIPYFTDPDNVNPLLRNFSLTANSTQAIDQGTIVPVFDDFTGQSRTGTYDIGAYEYFSGEDTTPPSAPANLNVL